MQSFKDWINEKRPESVTNEFINDKPTGLKASWREVENSWNRFLSDLFTHVQGNMSKYDAHHAKFGTLTGEHPDESLERIVKSVNRKFKEVKVAMSQLGAHEMI